MKKLVHTSFFTLFIFISSFCYSQTKDNISIYLKQYDTSSLSKKIILFHRFFDNLEGKGGDSIMYYVNDLREEGILQHRPDAVAMANYGMAPYLQDRSLFDQAEKRLRQALKYYKKAGVDSLISGVYNALGNTSVYRGEYSDAQLYYMKSITVAKRKNLLPYKMQGIYNLSIIYTHFSKLDTAEVLLNKYITYLDSIKSNKKLAAAYGRLGQLYLARNQYDKAISSYNKSIKYGLLTSLPIVTGNCYTNMGIAEYVTGNYQRSGYYFKLALDLYKKFKINRKITSAYYNLGDFYFGRGKTDSALIKYKQSILYAKKSKNPSGQRDALSQMAAIYAQTNQKDLQIKTLKNIISLQDTIKNRQNKEKINALKKNFNQTQNEIKNIGRNREGKLYNQLGKYQSLLYVWAIVLIISIVGATFLIYFLRKKSRSTETSS